jgi:SEC-C motif
MPHKKVSRNAPCPCGSGKKYKHCCYGKSLDDRDKQIGPPVQPTSSFARRSMPRM